MQYCKIPSCTHHPESFASVFDFHCGASSTPHRITQEKPSARIKSPTMESSTRKMSQLLHIESTTSIWSFSSETKVIWYSVPILRAS